ncbi:MAG: DUF2975 domain-containing protein [Lachnospiraceae bacterium]|nr:DUF2975 domain-containing protein [Lachnospiraceae bacterium]
MSTTAFDPKDRIRLSCNVLKTLACIFMFIDHCGYGIIHNYMIVHAMDILPEQYKTLNTLYETCRGIGRLAFPIFCFFLVEGFIRTRDVKKYALRLLVLAVITEIPFDLGLYGVTFKWDHQNIIITFFIALVMLALIKYITENFLGISKPLMCLTHVCTVIAFGDLAYLARADYSWKCILLVAVLYYLRSFETLRLLVGGAVVTSVAEAAANAVMQRSLDLSFALNPAGMDTGFELSFSFAPILIALIVLFLTIIFRYGAQLQKEADETL